MSRSAVKPEYEPASTYRSYSVAVVPLSTSRLSTSVAPVEVPSTEMPSRRFPYDVLFR